ncbi:Na+/H+ antiporter NhaC family protein [uncultured Intestinimonas sp.]|uniref:Na+/H+ antiporter NhaC family protein n=1 Tax=uncultured Intestinimonas sp. TaxID=1689265 RepID=UPI00344F531D
MSRTPPSAMRAPPPWWPPSSPSWPACCSSTSYRNIPTGKMVPTLNEGFANGVMPLIMVTAVVGIAQVVSSTDAFTVIRDSLLNFTSTSKVATAFSVVGITNIMALICGSASGAIAMTLEMFSDAWLAAGLDPEWIHRVVTTASGGFLHGQAHPQAGLYARILGLPRRPHPHRAAGRVLRVTAPRLLLI